MLFSAYYLPLSLSRTQVIKVNVLVLIKKTMAISKRDIEHIFERLRSGVVPERGLEAFAVGIDKQRTEIHRQFQKSYK